MSSHLYSPLLGAGGPRFLESGMTVGNSARALVGGTASALGGVSLALVASAVASFSISGVGAVVSDMTVGNSARALVGGDVSATSDVVSDMTVGNSARALLGGTLGYAVDLASDMTAGNSARALVGGGVSAIADAVAALLGDAVVTADVADGTSGTDIGATLTASAILTAELINEFISSGLLASAELAPALGARVGTGVSMVATSELIARLVVAGRALEGTGGPRAEVYAPSAWSLATGPCGSARVFGPLVEVHV